MKTYKRYRNRHRVILGIVLLLAVIYVGMSIFFMERFFPGTRINGVDTSWKDSDWIQNQLVQHVSSQPLTIRKKNGDTQQIMIKELGGSFQFQKEIEKVKRQQNGFLWIRMFWQQDSYTIEPEVVFYDPVLSKAVNRLDCMQDQEAPANAQVIFTEEGYEILQETEGSTLDLIALKDAVKRSFAAKETLLDLEEAGCYVKPEICVDSEAFLHLTGQLDTWLSTEITYEIGEAPLEVSMETKQSWITIEGYEASLDGEAIAAYIAEIADAYDSQTAKRVFYGTLQGRVVLEDKKHKWHIDREKETEALLACVEEGGRINREPYYLVPSGSSMGSEIGDTYVEVDVTAQHLWLYREGALILETDVVTGNMKRGTVTPGILAFVYSKERNRTLRGEDYESFVKYWVPFYKGYGLHDAGWRWKFGGKIYKTNGSHGCVNIPSSVMPEIYENVEIGMPVVIYY